LENEVVQVWKSLESDSQISIRTLVCSVACSVLSIYSSQAPRKAVSVRATAVSLMSYHFFGCSEESANELLSNNIDSNEYLVHARCSKSK